jgi:hypothetical protein
MESNHPTPLSALREVTYMVALFASLVFLLIPAPQATLSLDLAAVDTPNDGGGSISLSWKPASRTVYSDSLLSLELYRWTETAAEAELLAPLGSADSTYTDDGNLLNGRTYRYQIRARFPEQTLAGTTAQAVPSIQWFNKDRSAVLGAVLIFTALLLWFTYHARKGRAMFIRRIAGLEAVEEAVGRATEMGKPILYVPGISTMDDVATIASMQILGQVAKKAGEYATRLVVPNRDPIVMTVAQEVVRESYNQIGRPDLFREDDIHYVTYSQFGYAAAVSGTMMRERPATNFLLGMFYAESLILAETGNATGAIQIAGTDSDAQLPFFITACDYTLIGEELYAASVYLSREPKLLGSLKGQDYAKAIVLILIVIGVALTIAGVPGFRAVFK